MISESARERGGVDYVPACVPVWAQTPMLLDTQSKKASTLMFLSPDLQRLLAEPLRPRVAERYLRTPS